MIKRKGFLLGAVGGLALASTKNVFAAALQQAPLTGLPGGDDRVLVIVNLQGGNDGLNCIVPHGSSEYYRYRPQIGIERSKVLQIDGNIGFNPEMTSFKRMYDKGMVALVQGVGYPNPDHSHFRGTQIWQTADPVGFGTTGWLGRYLDAAELPSQNLFNAVAISDVLPEVLIAQKTDVPAISNLATYGLTSDKNGATSAAFGSLAASNGAPFASPYLSHVTEIVDHARRGSQELPKLIAGYKTEASYPATQLGRSLALAAQVVGSKLGTRVIYVQHGSFDTHQNQRAVQDRLLGEFSNAMSAFYDDLAAHGNDKRVLTMTFSEFGRRVGENASRGTDHGTASPLFVVGANVKGGLYGQAPSMTDLDAGDLKYTTDFRSVYTTVLQKWFDRPTAGIVAGTFPTIGFA
jgi:uncharacterized protein (DUF1501 family)